LIQRLLDRVEELLPRLVDRLERSKSPVARKTAEVLRNPPENLYITSWPRTPIKYEGGSIYGVLSGKVIDIKVEQQVYCFVIFFPIVQDAPDRVLLYLMAHEFAHVAGYEAEDPVYEMGGVLAKEFPDDFAKRWEYDDYIFLVADRLSPDEVEDVDRYRAMLSDPERAETVFNELMKYARPVKPVKPMAVPPLPAPTPTPPRGLTPEDLRLLREEFEKILPNPTPEELRELEGLLEDLQRSLADYDRETAMRVALEDVRHLARRLAERRAAPPVPPAPPAPPVMPAPTPLPVLKTPEVVMEWLSKLPSGEMSYLLTFGVEKYLGTYGGKYSFTMYDVPIVASALAHYIAERSRAVKPARALEYYATYFMWRVAPHVPLEGLYTAIRRVWDVALASLKEYFRSLNLPDPEEMTVMIKVKGEYVPYGFGRVWMDAMVYVMYRILGVEEKDIPEDLVTAYKAIEQWRIQGMPKIVYVG
jgi:hypothetical protein